MSGESAVDVVVLGLGPGGEDAAAQLARAGLEVVGIDGGLVGGECPYWGCVPSKMMIRAADLLAEGRRIPGMAGGSEVRPDWGPVAARIRQEATDDWDDTVAVERLERAGARFVRGWARLDGPGTVVVGTSRFTARRGVVLACGASPWAPPIPGLDGTGYWTNREAVEAPELPASLVVLGGGAIGVELAQVFVRFGVEVTVVEVADRLLALEEPESSALARQALERDGARVVTGIGVASARRGPDSFTLALEDGSEVVGERLLVATGRRPRVAELGLETVGIGDAARGVPVDGHLRAGPGLWALGDVTGIGAFTHLSMYHAGIVVADVLGQDHPPADHRALPRVTFTDPEIGSVGQSEAAARQAGVDVRTGTAQIPSSARGWIHKAGNEGFIKLVEDRAAGVLVGATSAGPTGGEVLGLLALAVHARVPTAELGRMIFAYPTFHRAVGDALADLGAT